MGTLERVGVIRRERRRRPPGPSRHADAGGRRQGTVSDDQTARILATLERLEAGQAQLRADLMARMDRLQNTVTAIRDDIAVNMDRADQAHRSADNVREELRSLNDAAVGVTRQVQRPQSDVRELRGEP